MKAYDIPLLGDKELEELEEELEGQEEEFNRLTGMSNSCMATVLCSKVEISEFIKTVHVRLYFNI